MYDFTSIQAQLNDLNALVPQIYHDSPTTDSILDDITEISKIVEWGKVKGSILNQQDLIALLDKIKETLEQEIKDKTSVIFHYKGNVANLEELNAIETKEVGDVYNVEDTGANYAWDGNNWDKLSETIDLSSLVTIQTFENAINNIYTKEQVDALITAINTAIALKADKETTYTKSEVDESIEAVTQLFNNYYDKDTCDGKYLTSHQDISKLATKEELAEEQNARQNEDADLNTAIGQVATDLAKKVDKVSELTTAGIGDIVQYVGENGTYRNGYFYRYVGDPYLSFEPKGGAGTVEVSIANFKALLETCCEDRPFTAEDVVSGQIGYHNLTERYSFSATTADGKFFAISLLITEFQEAGVTFNPPLGPQQGFDFKCNFSDTPWVQVNVQPHQNINNKADRSDLNNYYTKQESDAKYLTEHQDITGKQDVIEDLATIRGNASNGNDAFVTISNYGDIVTHNADEFLTEHQSLEDYYTKEQTDEKIHEVVGNAPEALDTLEEIAARLEDGTIASQIAELQNKLHRLQTYVDHYLVLTPEQEQQVTNTEAIQNALTTGRTVTIEEGTVCDIVVPEVSGAVTINAPLDENTSIDLTSPKGVTLNNTGGSTVNLDINAPATGSTPTITLTGNYDTVEVENASIKVNDGSVQKVVITEDNTKSTSVGGLFATNVSIQSNSDAPLSISNDNEDDTVNLDLDAPNSTVSLFKTYNSVSSTVGDNTLIIGPVAHIGTLTVEKGNVIVKDRDVANRIDTVINETEEYTVLPYTVEVNEWADLTGITSNAGKYIINEDIIAENKNLTYGIFGSGNCEIDLNNHNLKFGRSSNGLVFIRGTVSFNVVGNGYVENTSDSYGIWLSSETSEVNIYGGTWLASTHCMYAEKGTINIYGGEFKIKDEDKKFLLNCLDASYTSGKAHINVYGGKFYGFNPAQSMSEPGGPVSFVAPGYHVVETEENGETVYEVVAD